MTAMSAYEARLLSAPILVVDANKIKILLLENLLRQRGYSNVTSCSDPFQVAPLHAEKAFALILLDMQMPGLDGLGVMAQLRPQATDPPLPVLVITAQTDAQLRLKALSLGARDYVNKPFVAAELAQRIRNLLEVQVAYRDRTHEAAILEAKVRERTQELELSQLEIIHRLALAGEYRDNATGNHVERVSYSAKALALAAGVDAVTAEMIRHASPLHDVGKIGIPDDILLRPGKLEGGDLQTMRSHVQIGASILDHHRSPVMQMAHSIAVAHHERWDGEGYPNQLAGEAIPLEARIVAICDVFDALICVRPYKKAWSVEEALAHLQAQSGKHFDPKLVDCFIRILPEILDIRRRYSN